MGSVSLAWISPTEDLCELTISHHEQMVCWSMFLTFLSHVSWHFLGDLGVSWRAGDGPPGLFQGLKRMFTIGRQYPCRFPHVDDA